jgi:predicted nucleotidyltransferase
MSRSIQRRFGISEAQIDAIRKWAEGDPCVRAVRVFGSRAKGLGRIDSDLDIAISASDGNYNRFDTDWKRQLEEATGLRVGLSHYDSNEVARSYCADPSTIEIITKPEEPSGFRRPGGPIGSRGER